MGKTYEVIDDRLREWLGRQPMLTVATAPSDGGHVNVSPKGMTGTFTVLGPTTAAYLDYTGSGIETIAHLRDNGRITLMWSAFDGPPRIVRLQGVGRVVLTADPDFAALRANFPKEQDAGVRSVIVVECDRISDSCGFSVPRMTYVEDRDLLDRHHERYDEEYFASYRRTKNATSIDGLPALP